MNFIIKYMNNENIAVRGPFTVTGQNSCWNSLLSLFMASLRLDLQLVLTMNDTSWFETRQQMVSYVILPKLFS